MYSSRTKLDFFVLPNINLLSTPVKNTLQTQQKQKTPQKSATMREWGTRHQGQSDEHTNAQQYTRANTCTAHFMLDGWPESGKGMRGAQLCAPCAAWCTCCHRHVCMICATAAVVCSVGIWLKRIQITQNSAKQRKTAQNSRVSMAMISGRRAVRPQCCTAGLER